MLVYTCISSNLHTLLLAKSARMILHLFLFKSAYIPFILLPLCSRNLLMFDYFFVYSTLLFPSTTLHFYTFIPFYMKGGDCLKGHVWFKSGTTSHQGWCPFVNTYHISIASTHWLSLFSDQCILVRHSHFNLADNTHLCMPLQEWWPFTWDRIY